MNKLKTKIFKNFAEFSKRENKDVNGVTTDFSKANPNYIKENKTNKGCWNCSDCSGKRERGYHTQIPTIKNIHQAILTATSTKSSLNMNEWHTCDTTHCRAGWVVFLAGEVGLTLEEQTSTQFAASQIYKKSSDIRVSPVRFYETDNEAMEDIKRCAELEKQASTEK